MHVLLTGNEGYIGRVVEERLKQEGHSVVGMDIAASDPMDIRYVRDIPDVDAVIHLAGISNEPTAQFNPRETDHVNHLAVENLAKIAKRKGIKRFVFASSCSVYFTYDSPIDPPLSKESDEVNPISPYSISKRSAELALLELATHEFEPVMFRFGTVYGYSPNMRTDTVVHHFIEDIKKRQLLIPHANGQIWRPLADIQDVAWALVKGIDTPDVGREIFNVFNNNWKIGDLAEEMVRLSPIPAKIEPEGFGITRNYKADSTKFRKSFGWKPIRKFKESVEELWKYYGKGIS